MNTVAKNFVLILIFTTSNHCLVRAQCFENMKFKEKVFHNISVAECYTEERTTNAIHTIKSKTFLRSLSFISKYTHVSLNTVANYQIGYVSMDAFRIDKSKWVDWYDKNKCNNLK
jgi:hypothetical protein